MEASRQRRNERDRQQRADEKAQEREVKLSRWRQRYRFVLFSGRILILAHRRFSCNASPKQQKIHQAILNCICQKPKYLEDKIKYWETENVFLSHFEIIIYWDLNWIDNFPSFWHLCTGTIFLAQFSVLLALMYSASAYVLATCLMIASHSFLKLHI